MHHDNIILISLIVGSLVIKMLILGYIATCVPSAKFMPDTPTYLEPGITMFEKGVFATFDERGRIQYDLLRTPGYPFFLGLLHTVFSLSLNQVILVQIILVTITGYLVYRAACLLDRRIALLAAFIFLFDLPTTIASFQLLTEALYTFFMALFAYLFLHYLREKRLGSLLLSVITVAIATYIRPISYYFGICLAIGILYVLLRTDFKKAIAHALILLITFYSILGLWHYRNYLLTGNTHFTTIDKIDLANMGLVHKYARIWEPEKIENPFLYYVDQSARSIYQFFALPGTLKYLGSKLMRTGGKIVGYPWVVFWLVGFLFARYDKVPHQFLLSTVLYHMVVAVIVTGLCVGSRFRVPVMPFISILSASGWLRISERFRRKS